MIWNRDKNTVLADRDFYAMDFLNRFRGLVGRKFDTFDAMVFPRCSAIHTFFMGMKIDVLFLDPEGKVLGAYPAVPPWKFCVMERGASVTVELPEGTIFLSGTKKGDFILLKNPQQMLYYPEK